MLKVCLLLVLDKWKSINNLEIVVFKYMPQLLETARGDSWVHKPGLTHLSRVHSPGPSVVVCAMYK